MPQVVLPPWTLPNPQPAPLVFCREPVCRQVFHERFRQDDVAIFKFVVCTVRPRACAHTQQSRKGQRLRLQFSPAGRDEGAKVNSPL